MSFQINPETVSKKKVVLPKGSCRMNLKACHIESDDYADYASTMGLQETVGVSSQHNHGAIINTKCDKF